MHFKVTLNRMPNSDDTIPINYQYPLSAAIYKILQKGNAGYAQFLHDEGYGKGYKFFTFSDLRMKYKRLGDRMKLLCPGIEFEVHFHLPEASRTFVEGLFRSEQMVIADKKSKAVFKVQSIVALESSLDAFHDDQKIIQIKVSPTSALVVGKKQENGNYRFLEPSEPDFVNSLVYSWRNKIATAYNKETASQAMLSVKVDFYKNPPRSRLIHIKADTKEATQIKGYLNFKLLLTAEKRFIALAMNAGLGLYSAQGMGSMGVVRE